MNYENKMYEVIDANDRSPTYGDVLVRFSDYLAAWLYWSRHPGTALIG